MNKPDGYNHLWIETANSQFHGDMSHICKISNGGGFVFFRLYDGDLDIVCQDIDDNVISHQSIKVDTDAIMSLALWMLRSVA